MRYYASAKKINEFNVFEAIRVHKTKVCNEGKKYARFTSTKKQYRNTT